MSNKLDRFTPAARVVLTEARVVARAAHADAINPEHILFSLTLEPYNVACSVLNQLGIKYPALKAAAKNAIKTGKNDASHHPTLSTPMRRVIELAVDEARLMGHTRIATGHLLLGLLRAEEGISFEVLRSLGGTLDVARSAMAHTVQARKVYEARDVPTVEVPIVEREKDGEAATGGDVETDDEANTGTTPQELNDSN